MDFVKTSIKRPITIIMMMFIILLLGVVSLNRMQLSLMPEFKLPYVVVFASYSGAGPEEVENLVVKPLEQAISNVQNVKKVESQSSNGVAILGVELSYDVNMDRAVSDISERIDMIKDFLPEDVSKPTVMKINMDMMPIAFAVVSSDNMDSYELRDFVSNNISNRLERQPGVASVGISGGVEKEIRVDLNEERLNGMKLDINTLSGMLAAENMNFAGGRVNYGDKEFSISTKLRLDSVEDVKNTPIMLPSGNTIKLKDIADISLKNKELTTKSRYNKNDSILLTISKTSDANTVSAVKNIKKEIKKINSDYKNVNITLSQETASLIENSITTVVQNIFLSAILSMLILLVFLKNIGLTAIIGISMPFSIIGTFVFLFFSGTTLNMVSLGGLSIGVGMLVDNSIVVLENIYRYRTDLRYDKVRGTYLAASEVKSAVIASTLTTLVVFLPFIFAEGMVIQLMRDLALAVVFSLTMSLITALTIVPMMSGNYVNNVHRNKAEHLKFINKIFDIFDKFIKFLTAKYDILLRWAVEHKKRTLLFASIVFIGSIMLIPFIGKEFLPGSDEGAFSVKIEVPKGSNLKYIDDIASQVEKIIYSHEEITDVTTSMSVGEEDMTSMFTGGSGTSSINVKMVDKTKRKKSVDDIVEEIRNETSNVAGAKISVNKTQSMMMGGSQSGGDISIYVYGDDMQKLSENAEKITRQMKEIQGLRQVKTSIDLKDSQISVRIDKQKARMYGIVGSQIAQTIRNSVSGVKSTSLKKDGKETDIRFTLPKYFNTSFANLKDVKIKTAAGTMIPLDEIAKITIENVPSDIYHINSKRLITITANIYGTDFGTVNDSLKKIIDNTDFTEGYYATMGEESEMMEDTFSSLLLIVFVAILLVYMVMAAQFESFIDPFVIMFTIPLAFSGAFILMFLFKAILSVMSVIGALVLVGIVVNNGIVLVDYINTLRYRDGMELKEAVLKACPTRLRPILMTALTTILGQVPLIISTGTNSETMKGMGLVIAGGLATSTLLTLVIVPIVYMIFNRISEKIKRKFNLRERNNSFETERLCAPLTQEEIAKMMHIKE